jgi:hypothetical protein
MSYTYHAKNMISKIFLGMIDYIFSNNFVLLLYLLDLLSTNQHKSISFIMATTLIRSHLPSFLMSELDNIEEEKKIYIFMSIGESSKRAYQHYLSISTCQSQMILSQCYSKVFFI